MIKTLSPYYLNIPFRNPDTLVVCSSYTISIYIWSGNKSAIPATPEYQKTNINATGLDNDSKINVSRILNDFIDFKINQSVVTSLENGNNQVWVLTKIFYSDEPLSAKLSNIELATKGYGYFLEGGNPQIPDNKILLEGDEFKVNRNGFFVLPILLEEITESPSNITIDSFNLIEATPIYSDIDIYFTIDIDAPANVVVQVSDHDADVWTDLYTVPNSSPILNKRIYYALDNSTDVRLSYFDGVITKVSNKINIGLV